MEQPPTSEQPQAEKEPTRWERFKQRIVPPLEPKGRDTLPEPIKIHRFPSEEAQEAFTEELITLANLALSDQAATNLSDLLDPSVRRWSRERRWLKREKKAIDSIRAELVTPNTTVALAIANTILERSHSEHGGQLHVYKPYVSSDTDGSIEAVPTTDSSTGLEQQLVPELASPDEPVRIP